MEKQKKRSEIDIQYQWDLTTIFSSDEEWKKEYEALSQDITKISDYQGKIMSSAKNLYDYLKLSESLTRRLYKLYYYASLKNDQDTTNTTYQELKGKIISLAGKYGELSAYSRPEMLKSDYETYKEYAKSIKELEEYNHGMEDLFRYKEHALSEPEEKIITLLGEVISASANTYEILTDSDMKFGNITDENGETVEFTESNWSVFSRSKDRRVRQDAFKLLYSKYAEFKNTIASTFAGNVEALTKMAKINKFNSSIESSLYSDNVTPDMYNNLITSVHKNLQSLYDYYALKKEALGVDELHLYDIYVDLDTSFDKKYTFEEAKEIMFKALAPLGPDYLKNLQKEFDEHWIDVYNNEGKRGGAYSSGNYDVNPYILLNFEGTLDDVSTLCHESGHSMHTYLSKTNNTYTNSSYEIFVAEVASTVNEMLLRYYLLENSKDDNEKMHILDQMMELFKGTIYRQSMFAEFERDMHALKEQGEVLTHELLCDKYYELNKLYFGDGVVLDDEIKYEWERIPHFYYDFYVYKYVIGLAAASKIATAIYNKEPGALEGYMKFLSSGGSAYPVEELKYAGVDVTSPDLIDDAAKMFADAVAEYKELGSKKLNNKVLSKKESR